MPKSRGEVKTHEFVVELVRRAMAEKNQAAALREPGEALLTLQRYLKGIGMPSQANLEKLAAYCGVSVAWLLGNFTAAKHEGMDADLTEPIALCARCGAELLSTPKEFVQTVSDATGMIEHEGILRLWPCNRCCKE